MAFLIINSPNKNAFTPYPNAPLEHMVDSPWIIVNWTQFGLGEWHGVDYIQWRRQWHPTPVLLPGESMDGGAWWAAVHGVAKSRARLSDFTFTFHFHTLEKAMAPHSSTLAWRIHGWRSLVAAIYGVTQSRTWLKWLSSSSSSSSSRLYSGPKI